MRVLLCVLAIAAGAGAARFPAAPTPVATASRATRAEPLLTTGSRTSPPRAAAVLARAVAPTPAPHSPVGRPFADGLVVTGGTSHRLILFTFDDGPERHLTPILLDELDRARVKAVFFLTGARIAERGGLERDQAAVAQEIARRGHIVANHTMDHIALPSLEDREVVRQMQDEELIFERLFGERPWLLRPPGAAHTQRIDRIIASRGYTTLLWNLGTGDVFVRTPEEVLETWKRVAERRERENGERGGIILLHDIHPWSVAAFPLIHAELMRRNCELYDRGEELYDIVDDPRFFFVPREDAEPGTLAPPALPDPVELAERQTRLREETRVRCRTLASR